MSGPICVKILKYQCISSPFALQTIFSRHNLEADKFFQPTTACKQFFYEKGNPPPDKNNGLSLNRNSPHLHYIIFIWRLLLMKKTKLVGNSTGKFSLLVEHSKHRILHILKTRLGLECLLQHSADTCPIGMPNSYLSQGSNTLVGLRFLPSRRLRSENKFQNLEAKNQLFCD